MTSRYGDAIAAQAVTDVLAEGWSNGVAERTRRHLRSAARDPDDSRAVIDDGRRPLGVLAIIEDVPSDVASRTFVVTSSPTCPTS